MTHTTPPVTESDTSDHPTTSDRAPDYGDQPTVRTNRGLCLPSIGLGTWQLDVDQAADMVRAAIDIGYRHIDTAQMYGNETGVGAGITSSSVDRSDLFLTTKVDNDAHEPAELVASVERSLDALRTDHVDLLLIHWPVHFDRIAATMAALAQVQASGMAHHIGVSNFTEAQLDVVREMAPLEVLQVECHPFFQQRELRQWCVDHDWAFTAYSPVAQGEVFESEDLAVLAEKAGCSPGQLALAWLIAQSRVTAIPRTSNPNHLRSNFEAVELVLDADTVAAVDALDSGRRLVDPDTAPWN